MTTTRRLGRSGIEVSAIGMGCRAIGGALAHGPLLETAYAEVERLLADLRTATAAA
ncbi:hypothetical protein O7600_10285 [Micromonospora sp. WMMA1998]|uniref:hypothetical protein n=1 Tax=Micromonospora sp. WMMA1998 TaxID=3015167 RepID=UPI00248A95E5|nr:hypothetical protein [Micromonospora sp. WMMA1998]WBC18255.1 hypothetical protein O7600_10285 [Micromonospora sp. WMMA1998]